MLHVIELIPKRIALELPKEAIARRRNRAKSKMSELQEQYGFFQWSSSRRPLSPQTRFFVMRKKSELISLFWSLMNPTCPTISSGC